MMHSATLPVLDRLAQDEVILAVWQVLLIIVMSLGVGSASYLSASMDVCGMPPFRSDTLCVLLVED